ncbi:MAG: hypothetical protein ACLTMP_13265 [Eggerthella lenta]
MASKPERCPALSWTIGHVRLHAGCHRVLPGDHRYGYLVQDENFESSGRAAWLSLLSVDDGRSQGFLGELAEKVGCRRQPVEAEERQGQWGALQTLNAICKELDCQPGAS